MEQGVRRGVFYAVGVGPGDPELLTLKAVRTLARCPVIAAPRTKSGETLALDIAAGAVELKDKTVLPLYFPMERDRALLARAHRAAADAVEEHLAAGKDVALLNLGDVSIYATGGYLMEQLKARGYETVMSPGVPSFCAAAARLGVSLTEMGSALHIAPGSGGAEDILSLPGTKVLMKSGRQLPRVLERLEESGRLGKSMLVKNCGLPGEALYPNLEQEAPGEDPGYFALVIVKE